MAFKKGQSGNPGGRPPGSKDKATAELRLKIKDLLEAEFSDVQEALKSLAPKDKIEAYIKLLEYGIPKLSRVEAAFEIPDSIEQLMSLSPEERRERIIQLQELIKNEKQ